MRNLLAKITGRKKRNFPRSPFSSVRRIKLKDETAFNIKLIEHCTRIFSANATLTFLFNLKLSVTMQIKDIAFQM